MRERKIRFHEFRDDLIIRQAAGEPNTFHWNAPLRVLDPSYRTAEEIDRAIFWDNRRKAMKREQYGLQTSESK